MQLFKKIKKGNKITYKFLGIKLSFLNIKAMVSEEIKRLNYLQGDKLTFADKKRVIQTTFYNKLGYYPDINNPKTLNEKIQWLKLYYDNPLISICCDKYRAKKYIADKIGEEYVVKLLGVWDDADDIDFEKLPCRFVLKVNDSSGYNIVVKDKSKINISEIKCKLNNWVQPWQNCYYEGFHIGYKNVIPKIIAEEYLELERNSREYKVFCFNGKAHFMLVEIDYWGKKPQRAFYDRNFMETEFKIGKMPKVSLPEKPANFDKMIEIADMLAVPFPHVRVDFYDINGKIYIGEITFYSGGGFSIIRPVEYDCKLGELLDLDNLNSEYVKY